MEDTPRLRRLLRVFEQFDVVVSSQYYTAESLGEYAKQIEGFYFYDALKGRFEARSPSEHRLRYAHVLKRSKYFLCHFAKMRSEGPIEQLEFGPRYLEGLAAGCVLVGSRTSTPAFDTFLGWEDSVIEMP